MTRSRMTLVVASSSTEGRSDSTWQVDAFGVRNFGSTMPECKHSVAARIQDDFLNSHHDFGAFESRSMLASEPDWSSPVLSLKSFSEICVNVSTIVGSKCLPTPSVLIAIAFS